MLHTQEVLETETQSLQETGQPNLTQNSLQLLGSVATLSVTKADIEDHIQLYVRSKDIERNAQYFVNGMKANLDKCALGDATDFTGYFEVEDDFHKLTHTLFLESIRPHVTPEAFASFTLEDTTQRSFTTSLVLDQVLLQRQVLRYENGDAFGYRYFAENTADSNEQIA